MSVYYRHSTDIPKLFEYNKIRTCAFDQNIYFCRFCLSSLRRQGSTLQALDSRHSTVVHGLSKIEDLRGNDNKRISYENIEQAVGRKLKIR